MENKKNSREKRENIVKLLHEYATELGKKCTEKDSIEASLYDEYGVNLGLRDKNGNGVLTGLTNISKITSFSMVNGVKEPAEGQLWYRGYKIKDLIESLGEDESWNLFKPTSYISCSIWMYAWLY